MFNHFQKLLNKNVFKICQKCVNNLQSANVRTLRTTVIMQRKDFTRSPFKTGEPDKLEKRIDRRKRKMVQNEEEELEGENENNQVVDDFLDRTFRFATMGHQVFIVQPFIRRGENVRTNTTPELMLAESVGLVKTLKDWKIVDQTIVPVPSFDEAFFFKPQRLQELRTMVNNNKSITAVFVSVNVLKGHQHKLLQGVFQLPIFDRYTIVIQIFRDHARSREAKLQIQLAELPYLWARIRGIQEGSLETFGVTTQDLGGLRTLPEVREWMLKRREVKIKNEIKRLRAQREMARDGRLKTDAPTIAVVGYTNSGKTSLIKVLTKQESLQPEDCLFATLDVTAYIGQLLSNVKVFYVDTVGFISDIPTTLIESFVATLEDALFADIIIHVRDISHPDTEAQNDVVKETLGQLNISEDLKENTITVANKIDLVPPEKIKDIKGKEDMLLVSCTENIGIKVLLQKLDEVVLKTKGFSRIVIRVLSGGEEYLWLHEHAAISEESSDPNNNQYALLNCIISEGTLGKFKHRFIKNYHQKSR